MIDQRLLDILRCPMDPSRTRLAVQDDHLLCQRCGLVFHIKDGFPVLVVEEAQLPPGCPSLEQLPCQRDPRQRDPRQDSEVPSSESLAKRLDRLPSQRDPRQP